MEEEMNRPMIIRVDPQCSLSVLRVLSQALKIGKEKIMVLNKLFVLTSFCVLVLATDLVLTPIIVDIISKISQLQDLVNPNTNSIEGILKNFRLLLGLELLFLIAFFFVPLFALVATIYVNMAAGAQLSLKGWFAKIDISWKRPVINWFYITLISTVVITLVLILISVFSIAVMDMALIIVILMVVILSTLCYIYFVSVWILSLVISIIEENLDGVGTVARTEDHIRGRRLHGFGITLISSILSVGIFMGFGFARNQINRGTGTEFVTEIAVLGYVCMVKLFLFLVYSVYYYECKIRNGGRQVDEEERLIFTNQV